MRKRMFGLLLGAVVVAVAVLALVPRALPFEQAGGYWTSGDAVVEFQAPGQILLRHGPCVPVPGKLPVLQKKQLQVELRSGSFFFPASQTEQPYERDSLLTTLLNADTELWFSVQAGGPIPAGTYRYNNLGPIGMCGLAR